MEKQILNVLLHLGVLVIVLLLIMALSEWLQQTPKLLHRVQVEFLFVFNLISVNGYEILILSINHNYSV